MKKTETFIGFTDAIQDKSKIWKKSSNYVFFHWIMIMFVIMRP